MRNVIVLLMCILCATPALAQKEVKEKKDSFLKEFYNDFLNAKEHFIPHSKVKIEHYTKSVPIFSNFGVEAQVQTVYRRKVTLPSGGNVIFDATEALTSVDVNSAKSTKGGDIEETALNTNLEAAISIATQLKLRDIGGLIVVDFMPASSPLVSCKSKTFASFFSAHLMYILASISAQSWLSVPPAPAWISI